MNIPSTGKLSVKSLQPFVAELKSANHCYIAYSGGVDSHVLLHLLVQILPVQHITALHINHQLSVNASVWAEHCEQVCAGLNVNCDVEIVKVIENKQGLEAAAREARYQVFENYLAQKRSLLLMAHHADDQVETILYRLLRGAGIDGLTGIPLARNLGNGKLLRPLLGVSQNTINQYAQLHQLHWVEDESNLDSQFDRNYLRAEIVPVLAKRWPNYLQRMLRSIQHIDESRQLNDILAKMDFDTLGEKQERIGKSLNINSLCVISRIRQANVLRYWFRKQQLPLPGYKVMNSILDHLLIAREDASPLVEWSNVQVRRYKNRVYLMQQILDANTQIVMPLVSPQMELPDGSLLETAACTGYGLRYLPDDHIEVRFRQGGERCQPAGRSGSTSLKQLFQEYELEPWLRSSVPLIYLSGELAAVGDLWVCESHTAKNNEPGFYFRWQTSAKKLPMVFCSSP